MPETFGAYWQETLDGLGRCAARPEIEPIPLRGIVDVEAILPEHWRTT